MYWELKQRLREEGESVLLWSRRNLKVLADIAYRENKRGFGGWKIIKDFYLLKALILLIASGTRFFVASSKLTDLCSHIFLKAYTMESNGK